MFILTESTPNPEALKFVPHADLTDGRSWSFDRADFDEPASPLAARIFALPGVARVFIAGDFVTVTRAPDGPAWSALRFPVIAAVADHLEAGAPAVAASAKDEALPEDEIEADIRQVLGLHVRPTVARDGGEILFDRFDRDTGVLWIRMQGACGGCPSARLTLKSGVEKLVRRYVPEVLSVQESPPEAPADPGPDSAPSKVRRWIEGFRGKGASAPARPVFTHSGRRIERA